MPRVGIEPTTQGAYVFALPEIGDSSNFRRAVRFFSSIVGRVSKALQPLPGSPLEESGRGTHFHRMCMPQ